MLNMGRLRNAGNLNSLFPCVFIPKQYLQRTVFGEQSTVFCLQIKLMAANERTKKALYSCPHVFVSVGIVSVYKSCLVRIDCWEGWKIPRRIRADLLHNPVISSAAHPGPLLFQGYHERLFFFFNHICFEVIFYVVV